MDNTLAAAAAALESIYGKASAAGFGSAVFHGPLAPGTTAEQEALRVYQAFLGEQWKAREADWKRGWKTLYDESAGSAKNVDAVLKAVSDPASRASVELLTTLLDNPDAALQALRGAYERPDLSAKGLYAIGDGEAMSGVIMAGTFQSGYAITVVALMD